MMLRRILTAICLIALMFFQARPAAAQHAPVHRDSGGVLDHLKVASFGGSRNTIITSMAADAVGNLYVTGTTTAPNFLVKNAAQSRFGEARLLRTSDLGASWTGIDAPADVTSVVPDPVDPKTLFALGDTLIYKTADAGRTWKLVFQFQSRSFLTTGRLAIDPANRLRVAAVSPDAPGLIRSFDGGETWAAAVSCPSSGSCGGPLLADPSGAGALIVGGSLSRDWGSTYRPLQPPGTGGLAVAAFDPAHRGWIYAGTSAGVLGSFYLSTDFGATWTKKASPPSTFSAMENLVLDPDRPDTLYATSADGLFESTDGAASWVQVNGASPIDTHGPLVLIGRGCSGALVARASGAGFYTAGFSADGGATWSSLLTNVTGLASGAGCAVYVTRQGTTDGFLAKLSPERGVLWATYLGGVDQDTPVALALDAQGNAYLTGNTASPDFPATAARIGPAGNNAVFVTKFAPDGRLASSVLIGGESNNSANAIAVDRSGNIYVAGRTLSQKFPVTPGAAVSKVDIGSYTGFLAKFAPDASLLFATYLGPSYTYPGAMLIDAQDEPVVAGTGAVPGLAAPNPQTEFVMRLDRTGSRIVAAAYIPGAQPYLAGPAAIAADADGNVVIMGETGGGFVATPGGYESPRSASPCHDTSYNTYGADIYVTKLRGSDWSPIYGALLHVPCTAQPGGLALDKNGAPVFTVSTGPGFPLHSPLVAGPSCISNAGLVARLSPDGSHLDFSSYLEGCGAPAIAIAPDGGVYAGSSSSPAYYLTGEASVLRLPAVAGGPSLDGISNTFSGDAFAIAAGGLYTLAISGFAPPAIDLGLNRAQDLPAQLGGVEVKFDGVPAAIEQTGPGRVVAIPPRRTFNRSSRPNREYTAVQLFFNGSASNVVWMPVEPSVPGLLTVDFLDPAWHFSGVDGYIVNADGTVNSADHPAPMGSTITLFVTGMGPTDPAAAPGSIAGPASIVPATPVYANWDLLGSGRAFAPEPVTSIAGFVSAVFQMRIALDSSRSIFGSDLGNGVKRSIFGLRFHPTVSSNGLGFASNLVGVYVK